MTPFLKQVARYCLEVGGTDRKCYVFPNRRSLVFFRKWLSEAHVASGASEPVVAPQMLTINDLFCRLSGLLVPDKVDLLLELYSCYAKLNPSAEPLDDFIFWGDVLLGDFDDVDKYLVDCRQIFTNVSDFRNLQDDFSHLTPVQREAMEAFLGHFRKQMNSRPVPKGARDAKSEFVKIWNILLPLYEDFNSALAARGLAYEGHTYRLVAGRLASESAADIVREKFPTTDGFVFVGLNALNECEKTLMRRLRDASLAQFCWDFSGSLIKNPHNRSSKFLTKNLEEFPQAFELDPEGVGVPQFNVVSVPSGIGQSKQLEYILKNLNVYEDGVPAAPRAEDCAVILPDEGLLMPVLNSIPEEIRSINVTMGYPMRLGGFHAFMADIARMQMHLSRRGDSWRFYHKYVRSIFASGIFKSLVGDDEKCLEIVKDIKLRSSYYVPQEEFAGHPLLKMIFRPAVQSLSSESADGTAALADYQMEIISHVAPSLPELEVEFAKRYYNCVSRLKAACLSKEGVRLSVLPATYFRLLDSLLSAESIPFRGEPLKGLQIMGPLETRALDFRNVIILSSNEGMFPRRSISSSFIPAELRAGFDLPTYEHQDAVWAYYFYRLITRAENVWMLYDSRTEGLGSGEESRYIKQLKYDFRLPVKQYVASSSLSRPESLPTEIKKTPEHLDLIAKMTYSASSIQSYLACPAQFYYSRIEKLGKEEEVAESLDAGMLGTVFHNTMQALFHGEEAMLSSEPFDKLRQDGRAKGQEYVTADYLREWLGRQDDIRKRVLSFISIELHTDEVVGRNLVSAGVIVRYVVETIKRDLELLKAYGKDRFRVLGLELKLDAELFGHKFFGVVDRMDSIEAGRARVIDYKTGSDNPDVVAVTDENAPALAEKIFSGTAQERHASKAGLQFYIYDKMLRSCRKSAEFAPYVLDNSMYSVSGLFAGVPAAYPVNPVFVKEMDDRMRDFFDRLGDPSVGFERSGDEKTCEYCDFRVICGK